MVHGRIEEAVVIGARSLGDDHGRTGASHQIRGGMGVLGVKGDAQEKTLHELAEPPEFLHIATHGFFLKADDNLRKRLLSLQRGSDVQLPPPGDNPLLRAGLAFAGINANAGVLGEIDPENDGVLTALDVLSNSLWEVSDAGTQTLMTAVYKRLLAGEAPHKALRDSQIEMMTKAEWSAPYIWSAFFMVGT